MALAADPPWELQERWLVYSVYLVKRVQTDRNRGSGSSTMRALLAFGIFTRCRSIALDMGLRDVKDAVLVFAHGGFEPILRLGLLFRHIGIKQMLEGFVIVSFLLGLADG